MQALTNQYISVFIDHLSTKQSKSIASAISFSQFRRIRLNKRSSLVEFRRAVLTIFNLLKVLSLVATVTGAVNASL